MDKRVNIKDPKLGWTNKIQDWEALKVGDTFRQVIPESDTVWVETDVIYEVVEIVENDPLGGIKVNIVE